MEFMKVVFRPRSYKDSYSSDEEDYVAEDADLQSIQSDARSIRSHVSQGAGTTSQEDEQVLTSLQRFKYFWIALLFGERTRRTFRILCGMVPLYLIFLFTSEQYRYSFMSFALTLNYSGICYHTPATFGAACILEESIFVGILLGCVSSTYLLALCIGVDQYVTYLGIIITVLVSEPLLTSPVFHPFLRLFPWVILDSALIATLDKVLTVNNVSYVSKLWTGTIYEASLRNFIISASVAFGVGIAAFFLPPVSLQFIRLYRNTSGLLHALSSQFKALSDGFHGPDRRRKVPALATPGTMTPEFGAEAHSKQDYVTRTLGLDKVWDITHLAEKVAMSPRGNSKKDKGTIIADTRESTKISHILAHNASHENNQSDVRGNHGHGLPIEEEYHLPAPRPPTPPHSRIHPPAPPPPVAKVELAESPFFPKESDASSQEVKSILQTSRASQGASSPSDDKRSVRFQPQPGETKGAFSATDSVVPESYSLNQSQNISDIHYNTEKRGTRSSESDNKLSHGSPKKTHRSHEDFVVVKHPSSARGSGLSSKQSDLGSPPTTSTTFGSHGSFTRHRSDQSVHYDRVLDELLASSEGFSRTRRKANKLLSTLSAARAELPMQTPIPIPKLPFTHFSYTCSSKLWTQVLFTLLRTNRDGLGFSEYNRHILGDFILDQNFLDLIAKLLLSDSKVLDCLSAAFEVLTYNDPDEIAECIAQINVDLFRAQVRHQESMGVLRLRMREKHEQVFFRRKLLISQQKDAQVPEVVLYNKLSTMHLLGATEEKTFASMPKDELIDSLLMHYYESSSIAFLSLLSGTRLNGDDGSLVSLTKTICDKTVNRTWLEGLGAATSPIGIIPWQLTSEYTTWIKGIYATLVPFSFSNTRNVFRTYCLSTRGRHFLRTGLGLILIYAPSMFSSSYRNLFTIGDAGLFGAWQIHAFVSSMQICVETTTKKVFWRIIGNVLGGLVGFLALYISQNIVYHVVYLTIVSAVTTWILNGTDDPYFSFSIEFEHSVNAFGIVQHILVSNASSLDSTRELGLFVVIRVMAQIVGTAWALFLSIAILPTYAYETAKNIVYSSLNTLVDQVANRTVETFMGLRDYPVDLKQEYDECEKILQAAIFAFQQARKNIETAEKYGVLKFLGNWFYDGGEAESLLNWTSSVLTCIEGMHSLALRTFTTSMGSYQSKACIFRPESELIRSKIPEHTQISYKFAQAFHERFLTVVEMIKYYSQRKTQSHSLWRRLWSRLCHGKYTVDNERNTDFAEFDETGAYLKSLNEKLVNKQYEFWLAYFQLDQVLIPHISAAEFETYYADFYRFDAFLGFLRRLEELMEEIPGKKELGEDEDSLFDDF
eukprot:CAMPEP_0184694868 /NCGR_PEP_ID=MMETSP0313-20130426/2691_1 /TAXON_ID=2792 /ORGANISM="Porphyridium aerugineum, Strain SAG 1380-2" /LENGTH=1339 /DNA_ID=CAMNT_0027153227 /DNA_START=84 /DNA_END=4103 /DNA_ORIENTATION=-